MSYTKILSISFEKIKLLEEKDNPEYDREFDRLENIGIYTSDYIYNQLDSMDIKEKICEIKTISSSEMKLAELEKILLKMNRADLIKLSSNIVGCYSAELIVKKIINKFGKLGDGNGGR